MVKMPHFTAGGTPVPSLVEETKIPHVMWCHQKGTQWWKDTCLENMPLQSKCTEHLKPKLDPDVTGSVIKPGDQKVHE